MNFSFYDWAQKNGFGKRLVIERSMASLLHLFDANFVVFGKNERPSSVAIKKLCCACQKEVDLKGQQMVHWPLQKVEACRMMQKRNMKAQMVNLNPIFNFRKINDSRRKT